MRKSEAILSLALLGSAAASLWFWGELREERTRNAELNTQLALVAVVPGTQTERVPSPEILPDSPAPKPANNSSPEVANADRRRIEARYEDELARERRLMRDLKYREAWRAQRRLGYASQRENAIRLLGISPEQADAIVEIAIERNLAGFDRASHDELSVEAAQQQYEADERAEQAKLRELLGEEKRARWQAYLESRLSRAQVNRFGTSLAGVDMLRDDQVEPLIAALHVEQSQMQQDLQEYRDSLNWDGDTTESAQKYNERQEELLRAAHTRMHSAAAPILSHTQLEKLDAMLRRDREFQEAQHRMEGLQTKLERNGSSETAPD